MEKIDFLLGLDIHRMAKRSGVKLPDSHYHFIKVEDKMMAIGTSSEGDDPSNIKAFNGIELLDYIKQYIAFINYDKISKEWAVYVSDDESPIGFQLYKDKRLVDAVGVATYFLIRDKIITE